MSDISDADIMHLWPEMDHETYRRLVADISVNGLHHPPLYWHGVQVDGRARTKALQELGLPIPHAFLPDEWDLDQVIEHVIGLNLLRRDLNQGQKALVAARFKDHYAEPARLRRLSNLPQYAEWTKLSTRGEEGPVMAFLAGRFNVSQGYIKYAVRLLEEAPDLARNVEGGSVSIMAAMRDLEVRSRHRPNKKHARGGRRKSYDRRSDDRKQPWLPDIPGENAALSFLHLAELWAAGELAEPEEMADRLVRFRQQALMNGEQPDEREYKALEVMRVYIQRAQTLYQEGTGQMMEGVVVERPPLPEPAPEPMDDLLALALRLGVILAVRVLTAKRTAPAAPEHPWGRQWRVVSEAEWEAAAAPDHDPKAALV